eukprot:TRINITY_DN126_c0_g1_i1.p1 TRINITY_DN126_c0_g1~~TRINITY_DN126_c0_g1_i1.p1  ORF type:complete len:440 (+),score=144.50 TRINITY_DN126_c0_g1_i1:210-1529(+)
MMQTNSSIDTKQQQQLMQTTQQTLQQQSLQQQSLQQQQQSMQQQQQSMQQQSLQQQQQSMQMQSTSTDSTSTSLSLSSSTIVMDSKEAVEDSKCNLIVNFLPLSMAEETLRDLFLTCGELSQVKIVRDKSTHQSLGFGFVKYAKSESAALAIERLNGHTIENKRIKVSLSLPKSDLEERKVSLYISGLPLSYSKVELAQLCSQYGVIVESKILYDPTTRQSRGVGFVQMDKHSSASAAIEGLNDKELDTSTKKKLVVKYAERRKKAQTNNNKSYGPSTFVSPYSMSASSMTRYSPMSRPNTSSSSNYNMLASPLLVSTSSSYTTNTSQQQQTQQQFSASQLMALQSQQQNQQQQQQQQFIGVCLFVYHLPLEATEQQLTELFSSCGVVTSVRIMRDIKTNASKGYGFVNMMTMEHASLAIQRLHGYQWGNKFLKVSLKK